MIHFIQYIYNKISSINWYRRYLFWKFFFKKIWKKTSIMKNCTFYSPRWIEIWYNCFINLNCILDWKWCIEIWNNVWIGPNVRVYSFNHIFKDINIPIILQWNEYKKVVIWSDVWIGDWSIILPWVTIWTWSIVWAWSVVTKNIEPYSIVWWNPAKLIKKRF